MFFFFFLKQVVYLLGQHLLKVLYLGQWNIQYHRSHEPYHQILGLRGLFRYSLQIENKVDGWLSLSTEAETFSMVFYGMECLVFSFPVIIFNSKQLYLWILVFQTLHCPYIP